MIMRFLFLLHKTKLSNLCSTITQVHKIKNSRLYEVCDMFSNAFFKVEHELKLGIY